MRTFISYTVVAIGFIHLNVHCRGALPGVPATNIILTPKTMKHRDRQSIRLKRYQYDKPGTYFITIGTYRKKHLFGNIIDGEMHLNDIGQIVYDEWYRSRDIRPEITLDEFIIMPNHIHGIIIFHDSTSPPERAAGAHGCAPLHRPPRSLGSFIAGFKSSATKRINILRGDTTHSGMAPELL